MKRTCGKENQTEQKNGGPSVDGQTSKRKPIVLENNRQIDQEEKRDSYEWKFDLGKTTPPVAD